VLKDVMRYALERWGKEVDAPPKQSSDLSAQLHSMHFEFWM
jgi:hypothetical protein